MAGFHWRHDHLRCLCDPRAPAEPTQAGARPLRQREAAGGGAGTGGSQTKEAQHRRSNVDGYCGHQAGGALVRRRCAPPTIRRRWVPQGCPLVARSSGNYSS